MTNTNTEEQNRSIYTLPKLAEKHKSMLTLSALHNLVWKAKPRHSSKGIIPGNGLEKAITRVGRRVLIDEQKFFEWLDEQKDSDGA